MVVTSSREYWSMIIRGFRRRDTTARRCVFRSNQLNVDSSSEMFWNGLSQKFGKFEGDCAGFSPEFLKNFKITWLV